MMNSAIFRSYDIRGSSLSDIIPTNAYKIGFCFSKMNIIATNKLICVGRDGRLSSPALYQALINGLIDGGAEVISIGIVPTPVLYFADNKLQPAASIMITGSHNPKDDNGFKMMAAGKSFYGQQIKELLTLIESTSWGEINNMQSSPIKEISINEEYVKRILQDNVQTNHKLKVAWDAGNGATGKIIESIITNLPNINILINSTIDGNFPNHHPDPTVAENLQQLIDVVQTENCDFGIAFDGDGDRIGIVTRKGEIVWGDQMLCLFAEDILKNNPNATIIADVKASQVVFDQIASYGGIALMWKTGHSLIKTKLAETGALLAGEMSGHMFFADKYYGYDDALYAAIRLIELVSRAESSLETMLAKLPKVYNTPEIRIIASDATKFEIIEQIKHHLHNAGITFNDVDGLRVSTENGWWLLRASNTEPAIIARCESSSITGLKILKSDLTALLADYNLKL